MCWVFFGVFVCFCCLTAQWCVYVSAQLKSAIILPKFRSSRCGRKWALLHFSSECFKLGVNTNMHPLIHLWTPTQTTVLAYAQRKNTHRIHPSNMKGRIYEGEKKKRKKNIGHHLFWVFSSTIWSSMTQSPVLHKHFLCHIPSTELHIQARNITEHFIIIFLPWQKNMKNWKKK